jgi:hypothetical protein
MGSRTLLHWSLKLLEYQFQQLNHMITTRHTWWEIVANCEVRWTSTSIDNKARTVLSCASHRLRVRPDYLTEVSPRRELNGVNIVASVRPRILRHLANVHGVRDHEGDLVGRETSADILAVVAVACCAAQVVRAEIMLTLFCTYFEYAKAQVCAIWAAMWPSCRTRPDLARCGLRDGHYAAAGRWSGSQAGRLR